VTPSHQGRALAVIAGGSSAGTPPRQALAGYLAVRRSLGYKLDRPEKLLAQFIGYLEDAGAASAMPPPNSHSSADMHTAGWNRWPGHGGATRCWPPCRSDGCWHTRAWPDAAAWLNPAP